MVKSAIINDKLNSVALTLTGRQAKFEILTGTGIQQLKAGETVLTSDGVISGDRFQVDVNTFIAVLEQNNEKVCLLKKRGVLNFQKERLQSYRPTALLLVDGKMTKEDIMNRQLFIGATKSLNEFELIQDIVKERAIVKMTLL